MILIYFILCICFPAYAEDERYVFQNIQNEALYLQGYDLNEYYSSISKSNGDLSITIYRKDENLYHFKSVYSGNTVTEDNFSAFGIYQRNPNRALWRSGIWSKEYFGDFSLKDDSNSVFGYYRYYPSPDHAAQVNSSIFSYSELNALSIIGGKMTAYLEQVGTVFTWLLTEITELITFILGNPFLAVGLVLFMCGAVISFFIRIKNA